jgi:hypothetical protein
MSPIDRETVCAKGIFGILSCSN